MRSIRWFAVPWPGAMNHGPEVTELARFPGPARFVVDVIEDLDAGKSVVVVFPDALIDWGVADAVLGEIAKEGAATYCAASSDPFPNRVLDTFGAQPAEHRQFGEWETIIGWQPWHWSVLVIGAWEHHDVPEILERWPSQVKACGLAEKDRPKLVIGLSLTDVSRAMLLHLDQLTTTVRWWWGVVDRLDSETRLAAVAPRGMLGPVESAVIAEVAGWDLACIDYLVQHWDRTTAGIVDAVLGYQQDSGVDRVADGEDTAPPATVRRSGGSPPNVIEQAWRRGQIERWGYGIRISPLILSDSEIRKRVWLAHNRTLMPHVEDERGHFEIVFRERASQAVLDEVVRGDDIIEIGKMKQLVDDRTVDIGKTERERLQFFGRLRNKLAHRDCVDDPNLNLAAKYLDF
jgi:hypothetical protein